MPNETKNWLYIKGDENEKQDFYDKHIKNINNTNWLNFTALFPKEEEKFYFNKWELTRNGLLTINDIHDNILIETPWRPCDKWVLDISKKYKNLKFILLYHDEYAEDYYGFLVSKNGSLLGEKLNNVEYDDNYGVIDDYFERILDIYHPK